MMKTSLNVGVLGHVDCGKTTLTRRIAEVASTASFDRHAENSGRQNTLDLGFSSMFVEGRRIALIDCPGHASLIRAVLAASIVFDMAIVVIDASNGVQPQTAEHLLLCSVLCPDRVIIVLNKVELIDANELPQVKKNVRKGLKAVGVLEESPIIAMSLVDTQLSVEIIENLKAEIGKRLFDPPRAVDKSFLMAIDHCFAIKGKGSVVTGTVLQGSLKLNQEFEFPSLHETRKPKSLESWKVAVDEVLAGERAAMLVTNIDANSFSRTLVGAPGLLKAVRHCLATVVPIKFFRSSLTSSTKMHISIGFETVMAECQFLRPEMGGEFEQLTTMTEPCVVLLNFERAVFVADENTFLMASRLDQQGKGCRFAFHGKIQQALKDGVILPRFTRKLRRGKVERIEDGRRSLICSGMFKKETKVEIFLNMQVRLGTGEVGRIDGSFGKSGKIRISFPQSLPESAKDGEDVELCMKKYLHENRLSSYLPPC